MPVTIVGIKELRAEMKAASDAVPAEVSKALKQGSNVLKQRMDALAPRGKTGRLAGGNKAFSNARSAGVANNVIYAGVVEFATEYYRRPPGGTKGYGSLSKGAKNAARHGRAAAGGAVKVTVRKGGSPPRFGYKALDQVGDEVAQVVYDALVELLACHGWLD